MMTHDDNDRSGGAAWGLTGREQTAEALRKSETKYKTLYESSRDAITILTPDEGFLSGNPAAVSLFGCRDEAEFASLSPADLSPPYQPDGSVSSVKAQQMMAIALARGSHFFPWTHQRMDGTPFFATVLLTRMELEGKPFLQSTVRDITEQHRAEESLRAAKAAADAANRAKSTFLAMMSHEIRTPLNAVIGMTELVLGTQLTPQQRDFLTTVRESGESLLAVINDILDFSKIEAGKLALDHSVFDLRECLEDTMKAFSLRASQQGLELACCVHPEVPRWVVGDRGRLRQVVVNLVGNSIKFTERGEVVLEVAQESRSPLAAVLHFTVRDTGIGIPPEKQATVFGMFEQADMATTRRYGGTGLGLAIAARLVELMNGRIWVESEVGRGSQFHFTVVLELAAGEPDKTGAMEPAGLHGVRVLVVDDNATNCRILEEILRNWQMIPTTTSSAREAFEQMHSARQAGRPYRLVITDANMPEIDGFTLAEQIKQDAAGSTVVMMLTSGGGPEDVTRCQDVGIAAYLVKPVKQSDLLEAATLALGMAVAQKESPPSAVPAKPAGHWNILLAEDSLVNQKLAVALLEGRGHQVTVAKDGREAVALVRLRRFDLVLMDVQMPEKDGFEATHEIRTWERTTGDHIPIVAMTAHALKGDREHCLEVGMDAYVSKPIRAQDLFDTIENVMGGRSSSVSPSDRDHSPKTAKDRPSAGG